MESANQTSSWLGFFSYFQVLPTFVGPYLAFWVLYGLMPFLVLYHGGPTLLASIEAYKKAFDRLFEIGPEVQAKASQVVLTLRVMTECFWFGFYQILVSPLYPFWYFFTTIPYRVRYGIVSVKLYFKGFKGCPAEFVLDPKSETFDSQLDCAKSTDTYQSFSNDSRSDVSLAVPEDVPRVTRTLRPRVYTEWK